MRLLEQQKQGIEHLSSWKVGALFMEAGTGKTRVACELIDMVPEIDFVLWIGPLQTIRPKYGLQPISEEVKKWTDSTKFYFVGVESISASDRIFLQVYELIKSAHKPFIVVDESLKIKNVEAKRTKRILELGKMAEYKLILNGTPLSKSLLDLWSQMEFLSPKILNMTFSQFKNTFCKYTTITKLMNYGRSYSREYITGYENVDYLYSLIRHYVFQCDLSLNISQNYKELKYDLDKQSSDEYHRIKDEFLTDEMLIFKNNNIFFEMTQMMQHAYCIDSEKFELLDGLFKSIPQEKTIIFCKYIQSREQCAIRYPKAQVLSYQKEAFGLNLQDYNHTVYFDKIWDLALRIQSGRRTFRTGQEQNCFYYDLTGNVGLEYMIDRNIDKKVNMSEYLKKVSIEDLKNDLA